MRILKKSLATFILDLFLAFILYTCTIQDHPFRAPIHHYCLCVCAISLVGLCALLVIWAIVTLIFE